jgi:putative nucleotidyltransferase with HDIG domain
MSQQANRTSFPQLNGSGSRGGVTFFGVSLAVVLCAILFPWFPGGPTFDAGTAAERDILAPRAVNYESTVLTEQLREERAAEVPDQPVLDTDIRDLQLAQLDLVIAEIDAIRGDPDLSASARETAVRAIPGIEISQRAATTIVAAEPAQWRALADEARTALGRTLAGAIAEDEVDAARGKAAGLLSPLLSADQVIALRGLVDPLLVPTLRINQERTELLRAEARTNTQPIYQNFRRGEIVVEADSVISQADVEALDELGMRVTGVNPRQAAATALIAALAGAAIAGYLIVVRPPSVRGARRVMLLGLLLVVPVAVAKFVLPVVSPDLDGHYLAHALPLAAGPIAAAVLLDVTSAILISAILAAIVVFSSTYLPGLDSGGAAAQLETARLALGTVAGSFAGVFVASRADRLQRFLAAGFAAAVASLFAILPFWLIDVDAGFVDLIWIAGAVSASGLLVALIAVGAFVLLSRPFGIITRVELMELAQLSQPLLRRLQDEAPGTFQHSILVGNLAERAADRIGADPLLARVGAYYHDIGKLTSPAFFIENIGSDGSPHEGLDPLQSTRVILQHVSGGVEMARRARLPEVLIQFIQQHHGTRLVSFFYRRASEANADIDPELFRYAGPKPQSREAVLVMLADSCEAATRASADRSAERIRQIVTDTFRERMDEDEFNESPISLRDLGVVRESYVSTLTAVFHPRVEYPEPTVRELTARGRTVPRDERAANAPAIGAPPPWPPPIATATTDTVEIEPPEPRRFVAVDEEIPRGELTEDDS